MRRFRDKQGRDWDAFIGRESYGTMVLLFSRVGSEALLKAFLDVDNARDAEEELAAMDERTLCRKLTAAKQWDPARDNTSMPGL